MNESPIRKFCESPHRKLIVVIVNILIGLLVLIPLVDDYLNKKASHNTLANDLDRARQTAEGLPLVEQQVSEVLSKLSAIESRSITDRTVSQYRSKVVDLIRKSGCQVRRFDVGLPIRREWHENDNPLEANNSKTVNRKKTPFSLVQRNVTLLVDGPMENVQEILGQLHQDDSLAYLRNLELKSTSQSGEQVTLEIEMWLFALGRQKA